MMVVKTPSLASQNSRGKLQNNIDSALSCGRGDKGGVRSSPFVTVLAFGKEKPSQGDRRKGVAGAAETAR